MILVIIYVWEFQILAATNAFATTPLTLEKSSSSKVESSGLGVLNIDWAKSPNA